MLNECEASRRCTLNRFAQHQQYQTEQDVEITIASTDYSHIRQLRELHKRECNDIIFYEDTITDQLCRLYLIAASGTTIGYGALLDEPTSSDRVIEFFLLEHYRQHTLRIFERFIQTTHAKSITVTTSDTFLTLLLYDYATDITAPVIFFRDHSTTHYAYPDLMLRPATLDDAAALKPLLNQPAARPFYRPTPESLHRWLMRQVVWLAERDQALIGIGAVYHDRYNVPYADIAMLVFPPFRQRGYGTYIVQEMKRVCYDLGYLPSARCDTENTLSRRTLECAGFYANARMLIGTIARPF